MAMKFFVPFSLLIAGLVATGCASKSQNKMAFTPASATKSASTNAPPMIVTPANTLNGKVVSYNAIGRFVVLNFPVGQMPTMGQSLFLYRAGLKVAEVKITGPQRDDNIVADVVTGEAQVGDDARDQ
jgi:hypothetical protein